MPPAISSQRAPNSRWADSCRRRLKLTPWRRVNVDPLSMIRRLLSVEYWAEIRRLRRAEGMPIKVIARVPGRRDRSV